MRHLQVDTFDYFRLHEKKQKIAQTLANAEFTLSKPTERAGIRTHTTTSKPPRKEPFAHRLSKCNQRCNQTFPLLITCLSATCTPIILSCFPYGRRAEGQVILYKCKYAFQYLLLKSLF